ncbi:MAG: energy transducer TonB [Gammaproteobacteria bacterium]|nr:energy transducer TonB [Gammaproteobacteria bacterium]
MAVVPLNGMRRFLLWSLLAHGLLLLAWPGMRPVALVLPTAPELQVALAPQAKRSPQPFQPRHPPPTRPPTPAATAARLTPTSPVAPAAATETETERSHTAGDLSAKSPARTANDEEISVNELRTRIRERLAPHFRYPQLARRRGWQGTVQVRLRVAGNGRVLPLAVARSSGYRLLDRHALRVLGEIGQIALGAAPMAPRELDFAVIYRLLPGTL